MPTLPIKEIAPPPELVVAYKSELVFDAHRFKEIYAQYFDTVFAIALRFLKNRTFAKDAVQEVFIKLWQAREAVDLHKNVRAYLMVITRNCLLNTLRKHKNEMIKMAASPSCANNELDTEYKVDLKSSFGHFDSCLNHLPPAKRRVFLMKVLKGCTNEQIAEELELSINTVKFQYSQAKSMIKKMLASQ